MYVLIEMCMNKLWNKNAPHIGPLIMIATELWLFVWCESEGTVEQTVKFPVILRRHDAYAT